MNSVASTIYAAVLIFGHNSAASPRSVDDLLKNHGLPLFAATTVRIQTTRDELWPASADRLITDDFRMIKTRDEALKLSGGVLIYSAEPAASRALDDLILQIHAMAQQLARSSPEAAELLGPPSLPLTSPLRVRLVYLDEHGVRRSERHEVIELRSAAPKRLR